MKNIAAARVLSRPRSAEPSWEMGARYAAAYACTLIAIAGSQLIIPTGFALFLAGITVMGWPLSLSLRAMVSQPNARYSRLTVNRIFGLITLVACFVFLRFSIPQLFTGSGSRWNIFFDTGRSIPTLMQIFLIFAVCRSLVILSDKDTVHSALPAFCVLLLLIVVHKGPEVVGYFLAWTAATATLFALDHRQESRFQANGFVPAVLPGQDAVLSARSLLAVMAISLFFATILSYVLVSRQPSERGRAENMIIEWASRLTQISNLMPDASVNGGPERQIDFSSGPALPTRTPLWRVNVTSPDFRTAYEPQYWRMFTLAKYDGKTWSQVGGAGSSVPLSPMSWRAWPLFISDRRSRRFPGRVMSQERLENRAAREIGYDLGAARGGEKVIEAFGTPRVPVRQYMQPLDTNSGYLPVLPVPRAIRLVNTPSSIRLRSDGAVDVGVLEENRRRHMALTFSELPPLIEYGAQKNGVPTRTSQKPNPSVSLTPREQADYLQLPKLPARVKEFADRILQASADDENNYRRAQRLATAVQNSAVYTLRPPPSPENRDAVDYFLFESRRGYCTYFASALTALCRTQGIPARIVSGFTNTEWTNDTVGRYGTIRESNAHAWTEVWVPNWGWATVDATPAGDRGDNAASLWENVQESAGTVMASLWNRIRAHLLFFGVALIAVVLAAILFQTRGGFAALLAWLRHRPRRRRGGRPTTEDEIARAAIVEVYSKTARLMTRHFRQRAPWETPHEWFTAASAAIVPQSAVPLVQLADLYTLANYSLKPLHQGADDAARSAFAAIEWKQPEKER